MPRYTIRPQAGGWIEDDTSFYESDIPYIEVPEHYAVFTGLIDAKGNEIWREPNPMGFGKDEDW